MLKAGFKSAIALIALFIICTCLDPYTPKLKGSDSNLVVFAKPECANCELTGTLKKPDFWIDL
jgi:hypothetical protein